ncbi:hypothetical protein RR48_06567 [Papilio machaon]|uniref:Circadian clock-controlled protein n=1 Tax=Papilio machaon TaxID=76193 RepID=A0A194RP14_PAPMA|nr:hypothetical protein RR48_06567 [Papilio machaon]
MKFDKLELNVGVKRFGIPAMGVAPFDPHFAEEVRQTRSVGGLGYKLTLRNVYERGWSQSTVTKYKTDWVNERIIYSQYFPEKWLAGDYEFQGDAFGLGVMRSGRWNLTLRDYSQTTRIKRDGGDAFGLGVMRSGRWNLTLRDYSQTTRIKRDGSRVDVHVEVDHIGDMDIHVGNLLLGRSILEQMLDRMINLTWKPGFAVIRPLINDLVSTAFTDIWSKSFKNFPIDAFVQD